LIVTTHSDILVDAMKEHLADGPVLMWQARDATGGNGDLDAWRKPVEPAVRRKIIPLILAAPGQRYGSGGASGACARAWERAGELIAHLY